MCDGQCNQCPSDDTTKIEWHESEIPPQDTNVLLQDAADPMYPYVVPAINRQVGGDHYKLLTIQPAEFNQKNGLGFLEGCVIKRMCRHNKSTGKGRQDLEKAKHEIDLILALEYAEQ